MSDKFSGHQIIQAVALWPTKDMMLVRIIRGHGSGYCYCDKLCIDWSSAVKLANDIITLEQKHNQDQKQDVSDQPNPCLDETKMNGYCDQFPGTDDPFDRPINT